MAAKFEYEIRSDDKSKKGTASAVKNVEVLEAVTKKASKAMKAAVAGISFAAIAKGVSTVTKLYGEQEKVEKRLTQSITNNPYLNGDAVQSMTAYASALQETSIFGDEAIIQQEAWLASMGLTEDQIKNTIDAAVDLASTGMMSLEAATKNISKSFSGMTGELGEAIPALRELTAEELKAGGAVELIKSQFDGMAEAVAGSTEGIRTQFMNKLGDLGEIAGSIFAPVQSALMQDLMPVLDNIGKWLNDNRTFLINLLSNLPQLAGIAFEAMGTALSNVFSSEYLKSLGSALWTFFLEAGQAALQTISTILNAIGVSIWEPIRFGWETAIYAIKSVFAGFIDWWISKINFVVTQGQKIGLFKDTKQLGTMTAKIEVPEGFDSEAIADAWVDVGDSLADLGGEIATAGKSLGKDIAEPFKEAFSEMIPEMAAIVNAPLASDGGPTAPDVIALGGGGAAATSGGYSNIFGGAFDDLRAFSEILDSLGGIVSGVGGAFMGMLTSIKSVTMILNPLQTILNGVFRVLTPLINQVLLPLVGILAIFGNAIGQILSPLILALAPIIEAVGHAFVWLYNSAIVPVGSFLMTVFTYVGNAIIGVVNGIIAVINAVIDAFGGDRLSYLATASTENIGLQTITYGDVEAAGAVALEAEGIDVGASTGDAASYTAGRTINQTVNIYTDVIAGEGGLRDLALLISNEIKSAEALGA